VYHWDGSSWTQRGLDFDGAGSGDEFGATVSISDDGNTVAIGSMFHDNRKGHVRVFHWDVNSWTQRGLDIDGSFIYEYSGTSVSLSGDGNTVAIGAPYHESQKDTVRVFHWDGNSWTQRGQDIDGASNDQAGKYVSLSGDGNTVAIGAPYHDSKGTVRVYHTGMETAGLNVV
jgi:hypothetical protein